MPQFIGLDNYAEFLGDDRLTLGLRNTIIYAVMTSGLKVIIALPLAVLLTSRIRLKALFRGIIFFPVLVSTVAVGITFAVLMQPIDRPDQHGARSARAAAAGLAGKPGPRALLGGARRRLERRRHRDGDLHRRDHVDPGGVLRRGAARGRGVGPVPARDPAPEPERDVHRHPAVVYRRAAGRST